MERTYDLVLAGGGLANALIAWRLHQVRPAWRLALVEQGAALGGTHTWSYHDADLDPSQHAWIAPLVTRRWSNYDVRFPGRSRQLAAAYAAITAAQLHEQVSAALGDAVRLGTAVGDVRPDAVTLADGAVLRAPCVIDGRGPVSGWLTAGWQKFLGRHVTLARDHDLAAPLVMDATVPQHDGFRFVYVLPWTSRRLLIEDTYYSDDPHLEVDTLRFRITQYAEAQGWQIARVEGEERGVLPIPLAGTIEDLWARQPAGVPAAGMRAGLFHHTTGYSLPDAVRLADALAALPALASGPVDRLIRARAAESWRRQGFYRFLNRMLFRAADAERRYQVLERFYGLPAGLIHRFYAGRTTPLDRVRLLAGRPPVPLGRALRCLTAEIPAAGVGR